MTKVSCGSARGRPTYGPERDLERAVDRSQRRRVRSRRRLDGPARGYEEARPLGAPFSIADRVDYFFTTSRAMFNASPTESVPDHDGGELTQLVWADRHGNEVGTIGGLADYEPNNSARLSRDNTMLLTARARPGLGTFDRARGGDVSKFARRSRVSC